MEIGKTLLWQRTQSFTHLSHYIQRSHSKIYPQKLHLMLSLTNNLIRSSFHFVETKNLETTWYIRFVPSHYSDYSDSHPQYHDHNISKCSLLVVPKTFSQHEAVHHSEI